MEPVQAEFAWPAAYAWPCSETLIGGGGNRGAIYALNDRRVLKEPTGRNTSIQDHAIECQIYERLLAHPRILLRFHGESHVLILERLVHPLRTGLLDLQNKGEVPPEAWILKWAHQIINGLWYIHSQEVLQANIGCHNLLLNRWNSLKFSDFAGASIDGEEATAQYERRSRHPTIRGPNFATELFALGSTLYELSTTQPPYSQIDLATSEVDRLYAAGQFPSVEDLVLGEIITKCWTGSYTSSGEIMFDLPRIPHLFDYPDDEYDRAYLSAMLADYSDDENDPRLSFGFSTRGSSPSSDAEMAM